MDNDALEATRANIMQWLAKYREETIPIDKKIELILFSLATLCDALKKA